MGASRFPRLMNRFFSSIALIFVGGAAYIQWAAEVPSIHNLGVHVMLSSTCLLPAPMLSWTVNESSCKYNVFAPLMHAMSPSNAILSKKSNEAKLNAIRKATSGIAQLLATPRWCKTADSMLDDPVELDKDYMTYGK